MAEFGAQTAFKRTLPFSEEMVLHELVPYLKRTLKLVDVEVWKVEDALMQTEGGFTKMLIDNAEPGSPGFEFRNVTV